MTLNELIARVKVVALETANGPIKEELLNTDVLVELLLPRCLEVVTSKVARTPDGLQALRGEVVVSFVSGVADVPESLITEHLDLISFKEDPSTSYVPTWHEFQLHPAPGEPPNDYSRFHISNDQIRYHKYDQMKNTYTGDRTILGVLNPTLPTVLTDQVEVSNSLLQSLIVTTAAVVNGQTPLSALGLDYGSLEQVSKRSA